MSKGTWSTRNRLRMSGFGLNSLRLIQAAAAKFNLNPDMVLTAVDTYGKIQDLTAELEKLRESNKSEEERQHNLEHSSNSLRMRGRRRFKTQ